MKKLELIDNGVGGLDLLVEKDSGNLVRILTGNRSQKFFEELREYADAAIEIMECRKSQKANHD